MAHLPKSEKARAREKGKRSERRSEVEARLRDGLEGRPLASGQTSLTYITIQVATLALDRDIGS